METIITIPTDVGKSWYVVFLAFCQHFVKESIPFTFLIFIAKDGKECYQEIGFVIGAFYFGMYYLFSPLACALTNWYSFTAINIAGPLIMMLSMVASLFVSTCDKYIYLLLTYSLLGGFGCSMIHMSSKLMPSYWFCNRRQLAHCIAYSGQAFGFLFVPNIAQLIFNEIQHDKMKNMFYLFAVLVLPLIPLGALTPKMPGIKIHYKRRAPENESTKVRFKDEVVAAIVSEDVASLGNSTSFRIFKTHHNLVFPRVKDIIGDSDITVYIPDKAMRRVLMRPFRHGSHPKHPQLLATTIVSNHQEVSMIFEDTEWNSYGARPMYRLDIFYSWSLFNISLYYRQDNQLDYHLGVTRAVSRKDVLQEQYRRRSVCPEAIVRTLITMLDCHIATSAYYLLLQFNIFLISTGQIIPFIFILSRAEESGNPPNSSFLLVYVGLGQVFGRLLITTYGLFSANSDFYSSSMFCLWLGGFITILAAFLKTYYGLMFYSIIFGVIYAMLQTFRLTIMYSVIKLSFLTNAIGHSLIIQAAASIFGISYGGFLFSKYKVVRYSYIFSGCSLMLAGLVLIIVKYIRNYTFRQMALTL